MAIVVDKAKKRQTIALACKELVINEDIRSLTISKITSHAGIGKGSFYEYFENKEDLVFELAQTLMNEYNSLLEIKLNETEDKLDKLKLFASFFYDSKYADLRKLYNEFTAISLVAPNRQIQEFQMECFNLYSGWLEKIILEDDNSLELKVISKQLSKILISSVKGIYITCVSTGNSDKVEQEINSFIEFSYRPAFKGDKR